MSTWKLRGVNIDKRLVPWKSPGCPDADSINWGVARIIANPLWKSPHIRFVEGAPNAVRQRWIMLHSAHSAAGVV